MIKELTVKPESIKEVELNPDKAPEIYEGYLYRFTNLDNGCIYVGVHKGPVSDNYWHSSTDEEFKSIWKRVEQAKLSNSLDSDDIKLNEEELKKRYEKIAIRRVKLALIVSSIAEKNNIEVSNEELSNEMIKYSKNYPGQEKQIFEYFKKNPSEIEVIRGPLFEKKVIDFIINKTNKINKKVSIKEVLEIQSKAFGQK